MARLFTIMWLLALAIPSMPGWPSSSGTCAGRSTREPLVVGWHDEMNGLSLWKQLGTDNPPDVYASRPGLLTLRLPHVPDGFPYTYQWNGVTRSISADLGRYPVLVARVIGVEAGSYAHLDIEERDVSGRMARGWRSPTLTAPGLSIIDLGKEVAPDVRRLTLRLIVGGRLEGAKCEYSWVRFVRREDVDYLKRFPDLQTITSREPCGDESYQTVRRQECPPAAPLPSTRLVVGWSDALQDTHEWRPLPAPNCPDVLVAHPGRLRLTLGSRARNYRGFAFNWASMWRTADVDVDRYPILAVRTVDLKGPTWWCLEVQGYGISQGEPLVGSEVKTPDLGHAGLVLFDLQAQAAYGLELRPHKFRLRMSVAGVKLGGAVEYAWIRFVRREDLDRLRLDPDTGELIVEP